jgi:hypothetical protein
MFSLSFHRRVPRVSSLFCVCFSVSLFLCFVHFLFVFFASPSFSSSNSLNVLSARFSSFSSFLRSSSHSDSAFDSYSSSVLDIDYSSSLTVGSSSLVHRQYRLARPSHPLHSSPLPPFLPFYSISLLETFPEFDFLYPPNYLKFFNLPLDWNIYAVKYEEKSGIFSFLTLFHCTSYHDGNQLRVLLNGSYTACPYPRNDSIHFQVSIVQFRALEEIRWLSTGLTCQFQWGESNMKSIETRAFLIPKRQYSEIQCQFPLDLTFSPPKLTVKFRFRGIPRKKSKKKINQENRARTALSLDYSRFFNKRNSSLSSLPPLLNFTDHHRNRRRLAELIEEREYNITHSPNGIFDYPVLFTADIPIESVDIPRYNIIHCFSSFYGLDYYHHILSFLSHHLFLGIEKFIFYDRTGEYYPLLKSLIDRNIVEYYLFPHSNNWNWSPFYDQLLLVESCRFMYFNHANWITIHDIDEFLVIQGPKHAMEIEQKREKIKAESQLQEESTSEEAIPEEDKIAEIETIKTANRFKKRRKIIRSESNEQLKEMKDGVETPINRVILQENDENQSELSDKDQVDFSVESTKFLASFKRLSSSSDFGEVFPSTCLKYSPHSVDSSLSIPQWNSSIFPYPTLNLSIYSIYPEYQFDWILDYEQPTVDFWKSFQQFPNYFIETASSSPIIPGVDQTNRRDFFLYSYRQSFYSPCRSMLTDLLFQLSYEPSPHSPYQANQVSFTVAQMINRSPEFFNSLNSLIVKLQDGKNLGVSNYYYPLIKSFTWSNTLSAAKSMIKASSRCAVNVHFSMGCWFDNDRPTWKWDHLKAMPRLPVSRAFILHFRNLVSHGNRFQSPDRSDRLEDRARVLYSQNPNQFDFFTSAHQYQYLKKPNVFKKNFWGLGLEYIEEGVYLYEKMELWRIKLGGKREMDGIGGLNQEETTQSETV